MSPTEGMILIGILLVIGVFPFLVILFVHKPRYEKEIGRKISISEIFDRYHGNKEMRQQKRDYHMALITIILVILVMIHFLWLFGVF